MRDIYVVVPVGTPILAAADDFDRASMAMAGEPAGVWEVRNIDLLEAGD